MIRRKKTLAHWGGEEGDLRPGGKVVEGIFAAGVCRAFSDDDEWALGGVHEEVRKGTDSLPRA